LMNDLLRDDREREKARGAFDAYSCLLGDIKRGTIFMEKERDQLRARAEKAEAELTNYKTALEIANSSADELVCRWRELRAEVER